MNIAFSNDLVSDGSGCWLFVLDEITNLHSSASSLLHPKYLSITQAREWPKIDVKGKREGLIILLQYVTQCSPRGFEHNLPPPVVNLGSARH